MTTPPLQPGQYWRTRAGSIVYVASILPEWAEIELPVITLLKEDGSVLQESVGLDGRFIDDEHECDEDLITFLPDCDSLDWAPPEYPQWRVRDDKYGYLFRASEDTPWVRFNKHGASVPDRECLNIEAWRIATQEEAESRVHKPVPPLQKKYYKSHLDDFGYFRVDSNESYSWITPDGLEVKQCGSPNIMTKHPFVEITKEEAETLVKRSDSPETVVEVNDSVLSMLNTPTALLINGEIAGLITEVEFGLMNDEIRQKTPVARQYLGVSVSPPEVLQPPQESPVTVPENKQFHNTAPDVWSMLDKAEEKNSRAFANTLHHTVKLLIRICSAQQSMLSELSAQVDALRSKQS